MFRRRVSHSQVPGDAFDVAGNVPQAGLPSGSSVGPQATSDRSEQPNGLSIAAVREESRRRTSENAGRTSARDSQGPANTPGITTASANPDTQSHQLRQVVRTRAGLPPLQANALHQAVAQEQPPQRPQYIHDQQQQQQQQWAQQGEPEAAARNGDAGAVAGPSGFTSYSNPLSALRSEQTTPTPSSQQEASNTAHAAALPAREGRARAGPVLAAQPVAAQPATGGGGGASPPGGAAPVSAIAAAAADTVSHAKSPFSGTGSRFHFNVHPADEDDACLADNYAAAAGAGGAAAGAYKQQQQQYQFNSETGLLEVAGADGGEGDACVARHYVEDWRTGEFLQLGAEGRARGWCFGWCR